VTLRIVVDGNAGRGVPTAGNASLKVRLRGDIADDGNVEGGVAVDLVRLVFHGKDIAVGKGAVHTWALRLFDLALLKLIATVLTRRDVRNEFGSKSERARDSWTSCGLELALAVNGIVVDSHTARCIAAAR
jgi:hypothetical protein